MPAVVIFTAGGPGTGKTWGMVNGSDNDRVGYKHGYVKQWLNGYRNIRVLDKDALMTFYGPRMSRKKADEMMKEAFEYLLRIRSNIMYQGTGKTLKTMLARFKQVAGHSRQPIATRDFIGYVIHLVYFTSSSAYERVKERKKGRPNLMSQARCEEITSMVASNVLQSDTVTLEAIFDSRANARLLAGSWGCFNFRYFYIKNYLYNFWYFYNKKLL
jgi:hypothetical protein